jgi:hypothetical protein
LHLTTEEGRNSMSTVTPMNLIKAYSTTSNEEERYKYVKSSEVVKIALALLQENGMVPFYYGLTKEQVYLGAGRVTYVVSSAFISAVQTLAKKNGIAASLKDPFAVGINIQGSPNTAGILLVRDSKL